MDRQATRINQRSTGEILVGLIVLEGNIAQFILQRETEIKLIPSISTIVTLLVFIRIMIKRSLERIPQFLKGFHR
jgi:hypothetical protein